MKQLPAEAKQFIIKQLTSYKSPLRSRNPLRATLPLAQGVSLVRRFWRPVRPFWRDQREVPHLIEAAEQNNPAQAVLRLLLPTVSSAVKPHVGAEQLSPVHLEELTFKDEQENELCARNLAPRTTEIYMIKLTFVLKSYLDGVFHLQLTQLLRQRGLSYFQSGFSGEIRPSTSK